MARSGVIHILRHGQALHNVDRNYPHRDPPLTSLGESQAKAVDITETPDLIVISPMTRTIQTTLLAFGSLLDNPNNKTEVQIWPDLREAHDYICNKGVSRAELAAKFPKFDFTECHEEWDYPPHNAEDAVARAERVRKRLRKCSGSYENIVVVTHRGLVAFLVKGDRFNVGECRRYQFRDDEVSSGGRYGVSNDTGLVQDFGPSVLFPLKD